ncbi:GNAT family N-acetyltransferase [Halocatena halophila]|uniref:GNAT family N-acetyltransferase n=1 Tax=Halocatena halophila TaxID=2814576 RepID=UPI002ED2829D
MDDITIRTATVDELTDVMGVIDAGLLACSIETVRSRIEANSVLVAATATTVVGVLVREGELIKAIAVRPNRRGQSIGSRLIDTAGEGRRLCARFSPAVRPFYEHNDFEITNTGERLRGIRPAVR